MPNKKLHAETYCYARFCAGELGVMCLGIVVRKILYLLLFFSSSAFANQNEIQIAREAAPIHIVDRASFMVWENNKFVEVVK